MKKQKDKFKYLDKSLSIEVYNRLRANPDFDNAVQLAYNKCTAKPYLVGGRVYRTLIEVLYGYPAQAYHCDFDFTTTRIKEKKLKPKPKKKRFETNSYFAIKYIIPEYKAEKYNGQSLHLRTYNGSQIDIINIGGFPQVKEAKLPNKLSSYFKIVPLSIQAIAMDIERRQIFGLAGIDSIYERFVWVNNKEQLDQYCKYKSRSYRIIAPHDYLSKKAKSIRFNYEDIRPKITFKFDKDKETISDIVSVMELGNFNLLEAGTCIYQYTTLDEATEPHYLNVTTINTTEE